MSEVTGFGKAGKGVVVGEAARHVSKVVGGGGPRRMTSEWAAERSRRRRRERERAWSFQE